MKKVLILVFFCATIFFLGRELNPFDLHFFTVHDNTQVARMSEFAFNLKSEIIPPRLAPHFSFNHGFPVFNFYAPFSYWIGGILSIFISPAIVLKILFLFGLMVSFFSMFLLISTLFSFWAGILSGIIYVSSLWMAVEIFVRGNVGEVWFMGLFPLALFFITYPRLKTSVWFFAIGSLTLMATLTVHNVLSLISLFVFVVLLFIVKGKKRAAGMLIFGLLLSSYFLIPALLENKLTYANTIAAKTHYEDHFLCAWQLWKANGWNFGGSGIGCVNDDMSFQLGKPHIILGLLGMIFFIYGLIWRKKTNHILLSFFVLGLGIVSTLLTLSFSKPMWDIFSPVMKVFQFPWRFLPFVLFALSYFSAYIIEIIKNVRIQVGIAILCSLCLLFLSYKFFSKPWKYNLNEYSNMFLTNAYITTKAAYEIPEYFPRTGNYSSWRLFNSNGFEGLSSPFYKQIKGVNTSTTTLPIHYFPFWEIRVNSIRVIPDSFDTLGRPVLTGLPVPSNISVRYNETPIEKAADIITCITFITVICMCLSKRLWKKMNAILQ